MVMSGTNIGHLEDEALKRREKLKALRRNKQNAGKGGNNDSGTLPTPIFRSYKPIDDSLNEHALPSIGPSDVTSQVKAQIEAAETEIVIDQLNVAALAPRKPDWDLKRDVSKKLQKLERQTQKAIAELIRERLKSGNEDLAAIVNAEVSSTSK